MRFGRFTVRRLIGQGGMASVYEACDPALNRRVAIKVLHAAMAANKEVVGRFLLEGHIANGIRHLSMVAVHEQGQMPDGCVYQVMDLLEGETLSSRIARRRRMGVEETLHIVGQIAEAMSHVHSHGVIHRDLKPENIMLIPDAIAPCGERVKILDFGLAKLCSDNVKAYGIATQVGVGLGTILYIAPEQVFDARGVNDKADVYALGCILFQMVSGRCPFTGESDQEVLGSHLTRSAPDLQDLIPAVPQRLSRLVLEMLSKDPERRPSMRQVVWTMDGILNAVRQQGRHAAAMPTTVSPAQPKQPKQTHRTGRAILIGVASAILPILVFTYSCSPHRALKVVDRQEAESPANRSGSSQSTVWPAQIVNLR